MTVFQERTLFGPAPPLEERVEPRARGVQGAQSPTLHEWSPDVWSLCAPGVALPACKERERLALPLLIRAIQAADPSVSKVHHIHAGHVTAGCAVLLRLQPSKDLAAAIAGAADALFECLIDHEASPYEQVHS